MCYKEIGGALERYFLAELTSNLGMFIEMFGMELFSKISNPLIV